MILARAAPRPERRVIIIIITKPIITIIIITITAINFIISSHAVVIWCPMRGAPNKGRARARESPQSGRAIGRVPQGGAAERSRVNAPMLYKRAKEARFGKLFPAGASRGAAARSCCAPRECAHLLCCCINNPTAVSGQPCVKGTYNPCYIVA